jgi:hypothetical protein
VPYSVRAAHGKVTATGLASPDLMSNPSSRRQPPAAASAPAAARTVTCPAGITRHLTTGNAVIFGAACRACPLRQRCTTAKGGRTLRLHEHDGLLRAARADWAAGPGLRQDYMAHRPHVERTIAPGRHLAGTPPQAPLPRSDPQPRLAQAPHRRAEPAQPARPRPGPPRRRLDPGHLTRRQVPPAPAAAT